MQLNVNVQVLLIGGLVVACLVPFVAPYAFSDVRQAFGAGWITFGLLLMLSSPKRPWKRLFTRREAQQARDTER